MTATQTEETPSAIEFWDVDKLVSADDNPRGDDLGDIEGLADSIRAVGILEPLLVTLIPGTDQALILAGHRRKAAAELVGLKRVEVIVSEGMSDTLRQEWMLIENLQRKDLTGIQLARGFKSLADLGMSQRDIARKVGVSQSVVSKHISLLKLDDEVLDRVVAGEISQEDAITLGSLSDELRLEALENIQEGRRSSDAIRLAKETAEEMAQVEAKLEELRAEAVRILTEDELFGDEPGAGPKSVASLFWLQPKEKAAHLEATCRAVFVRSNGTDIVEYCTHPENHPQPKEKPAGRSAATVSKKSAAAIAKEESVEKLRSDLGEANERRIKWAAGLKGDTGLAAAALEIRLCCDEFYVASDELGQALGIIDPTEALTDEEAATKILASKVDPLKVLFMSIVLCADGAVIRGSYGEEFELHKSAQPDAQQYLDILGRLGYKPSWVECKFVGLPYEEPQLPGEAPAEPAAAVESNEQPEVTVVLKQGRFVVHCTHHGDVTKSNKVKEYAEERAELHRQEHRDKATAA